MGTLVDVYDSLQVLVGSLSIAYLAGWEMSVVGVVILPMPKRSGSLCGESCCGS
jgi:hypothetical protein